MLRGSNLHGNLRCTKNAGYAGFFLGPRKRQ